MRGMHEASGGAAALLVFTFTFTWRATAFAQGLPPLPTPAETPPAAAQPSPPPPAPPPPPVEPAPLPPPPPRVVFVELEPPVHTPPFSLWVGGRLGLLAYSGGLYINNQKTGGIETTGNFVTPGPGLEVDVGARLGKRYIPYFAFEWGLVAPGHRFEGATTSTTAQTRFIGGGFRYLAGDVDTVSFASDLSFGYRTFSVTSGGSTWTSSAVEIFRLGLGAEIRVHNHFAVSPMLTLSGGTMTDTSGNVSFAPNQGDGQKGPPFTGNGNIPGWAQTSYYAIFIGCGVHADLFGK